MRRPALLLAAALAAALPALGDSHPAVDCTGTRLGNRTAAASGVADPAGEVRVFAIQYRQDLAYVSSYWTFREKMECLLIDYVLPNRSPDVPNVVVLNEDIGLATLGIGTRGAPARAIAASPLKDPGSLAGAISAFATVGAAYAPQVAYYAGLYPETSPQRLILAAATDTLVRAFMQTFSDLARRYGLYIVASNNQAEFREVHLADRPEAAVLVDPDLARRYARGQLETVFEAVDDGGPGIAAEACPPDNPGCGAAGINVHNKAFMWSPNTGVEPYAARRFSTFAADGVLRSSDPRSNLVAVNKKTPITQIERDILDLTDDGDLTVENTGPFPLPGENSPTHPLPAAGRIGFGISLPSFMWGTQFGVALEAPDACASRFWWMRCLDQRGMNLFLQPEANPGCCWTEYHDGGWRPPAFQSLSWLDSSWRAVADPTVRNIRYAVTPFMVGNLVDLPFDGQSSIFERCIERDTASTCAGNTPRNHVGASDFIPCPTAGATRCDDPALLPYSGAKDEAIVMADWVLDDLPGDPVANRERLAERGRQMMPGSGSEFENGYLETAIWADLDLD